MRKAGKIDICITIATYLGIIIQLGDRRNIDGLALLQQESESRHIATLRRY